MRRVLPLAAVAVLVLLVAGTGGVAAADAAVAETAADCQSAADNDLVGCWNGTYHAAELDFDQEDGLTTAQLETLTHRSMARVEYLRERPFETSVPVETVTREEFRANGTDGNGTDAAGETEFDRWNDQVWEALFVVGTDESSAAAIDTVFGGSVSGFYSPADDRIVLVVAEGEALQVSESTLVHELTHAMQDQYHDLAAPRFVGATQDADLAVDGIVEGEAVYVEERYADRCEANWSCLAAPDSSGSGGGSTADYNVGILQTVLQPYSDGPFYVEALIDEGGWSAVNETMNDPPNATAAVIHRESGYETREIEFEDAAEGGWETYADQGANGSETAGEASMFVMFWYQSWEYDHPVLEPTRDVSANVRIHTVTDERLDTRSAYNYADPATTGWVDDELYPYRNDAGDAERDGYVWVTEWRTPTDAAEFHAAYRTMLAEHGAERLDDGVREIPSGDFRGAYGVERDGTRVTIVHGPEPADVLELRPGIDLADSRPGSTDDGAIDGGSDPADGAADADGDPPGDGTTDGGATDDGTRNDGAEPADGSTDDDTRDGGPTDGSASGDDGTTEERVPGLGVVAALVALSSAVVALRRRSRR
ncbi:Hvo_1808 family surface protein [Halorubrum halodurans]|uniref:PGF-CTERM sorting domain-containing protein n=1 Tax=Halorubrum halodurans TaxID=1383851 RepID=A0A256IBH0_9EURY|nr:Hvo_1808 family surface protein [Halorubrum halodurans]OYR53646.1 PGF-CTERM sorting domain-containing protein [Halorubrum halodurans]